MIYTVNVTSTSPGTAKALAATRTPFCWARVQALDNNSNPIYVAGVDPTTKQLVANVTNRKGLKLTAGSSTDLLAISSVSYGDLALVGFDVQTTGDAVSVTYAIR